MKAKVQAAEKNAKMLDKIIDFYLHPIEIQDFNAFCKRYQILSVSKINAILPPVFYSQGKPLRALLSLKTNYIVNLSNYQPLYRFKIFLDRAHQDLKLCLREEPLERNS